MCFGKCTSFRGSSTRGLFYQAVHCVVDRLENMAHEGEKFEEDALASLENEILHLNIPLPVIEDKYSVQGSADRDNLVLIVESLAHKTLKELQEDAKIHRRYATKGKLYNQTRPVKKDEIKYDDFPLILTYKECCWNDVDIEDLQLSILHAIGHVHDHYKWHNVRIIFDHFISAKTKKLIDMMDSDNEDEETPQKTDQGTSQETIHVAQTAPTMPPKPNEPDKLVRQDVIDDDDECVIVFESP